MTTPTNQITIAEFRANYDQYMKRMDAGEVFSFSDFDINKDNLYKPMGDQGIPIDIEEVKF